MSLLSKIRCAFTLGQGLLIENKALVTTDDPILFFKNWLKEAENSGIILPESMSVSTSTKEGRPSSRMVLLKEVGSTRICLLSQTMAAEKPMNSKRTLLLALLFHWNMLQRQVRIEGRIERISQEESESLLSLKRAWQPNRRMGF